MHAQGFNLALLHAAIANVGIDKVSYSALETLPAKAILLVSGPLSFVKNWNQKIPNPIWSWVTNMCITGALGMAAPSIGLASGMTHLVR
jgi:hypothetical protein